ncbi:DUF559 domain-containing protein [Leucobacter insecticola]|uniref:DUF559 domain-containing protein n=1 Tax=Leucobacter insecticola TaxID=2714934 RepID=A0A6G8FG31_9MICO|nr:DUF559 domain-containing protein [Leucobacter insecticola]QIM15297.1 DUF559 domain-containing protein [Leucobacter insecticola]
MSVEATVRDLGGVTLSANITALGFSYYEIKKAVDSGGVSRPRKRWLAVADADPALVLAAQQGVVLSCVSQAQRLKLWVLNMDGLHVAARSRGRRLRVSGTIHWQRPLVVRAPDSLEDPIENVLDCVARCQPHDAALTIWESALQRNLTDYLSLSALPLGPQARHLLEEASPFSDSGIETLFRTRLTWLDTPIRAQTWLLGHRVDFLIGDRLVIQIDGKQHSGAQATADMTHDAELRQRGFHVIRVNYALIVYHWPRVQDLILGAVSRGLHQMR